MAVFLDVIEHTDQTADEIVHRWPQDGSAEVMLGSQLVVQESQWAVFYRDGRALDAFTAGRHTLSTQNLPLVAKLLGLPFGGKSPFRTAVVFVSRRTLIDQKWGTRDPVTFRDAELGLVRLRAYGNYGYRIADPQLFVSTIVGSQGLYETSRLAEFYRDVIVARLNDLLGETVRTLADLPQLYDELATAAKARLVEDFSRYGVDLTDFYISAITPPDDVQARIDERSGMGVVGDPTRYMQFKAAQALGDAAKAGGAGAMGTAVGLGAGAGVGAMLPGMMRDALAATPPSRTTPATSSGSPAPAGAAVAVRYCTQCGTALDASWKFCAGCGNRT